MVKRLRFLAVMLCIISLITGCEFSKKYDGQVTAVIHNEADTFELAVAEEELISYYEKSNKLGYDLFKNNLDDNKIISPITLSNTLLDLSEIFNKDFSLFLNDAIPNFKDNIDAKDFSKSSLQDLTSKRAIWINYNLALRYNANALNFNNFKDFDFYLIDNLYETRNDVINAYVKEKLETKQNLVETQDNYDCEIVDINSLNSKILLIADAVSYKTHSFKGKAIIADKQYVAAKNLNCKYFKNPELSMIELPLESKNNNLVLDIITTSSKQNINEIILKYDYDQFSLLLKNLEDSPTITIKNFEMPSIDNIYNCSNNNYFIESNLGFIFDNLSLNTNQGNLNDIQIDQINQINKLSLDTQKINTVIESSNTVTNFKVYSSFIFVIRDTINNSIIYIGNMN